MANEQNRELLNTTLRINETESVYPVFKALASVERLDILNLLGTRSMNVHHSAHLGYYIWSVHQYANEGS